MDWCDRGSVGGFPSARHSSRPMRGGKTPTAGSMSRVERLEARAYLTSIPLAPAANIGGVASPAGIAVADFNANGVSDIAVVGIDPATNLHAVAIFLDGATTPVFYDLTGDNSAQDIVTGDFNGDGNTDIAVSDPVDGTVDVLLGNGDGTFQAPITTRYGTAQPVGTPATAYLASADFNGDGMADLAVTDLADHQISILLGNGKGGFTLGTPITSTEASFDPQHIVTADFNNDGLPDLVYNDGTAAAVDLVEGTGTGTFGAPIVTAVDGPVQALATGDLNGDGQADLVASVSTGTGTGTIDTLQNSAGVFAAAVSQPTSITSPAVVAIGDINGDGLADLVTMNSSGALEVFPGIGGGYFGAGIVSQATSGSPQAIVTNDLNGDDKADIIFSETDPALTSGGGIGAVLGASAPELSTGISGALPASAVAGVKASIVQTVRLTNIAGRPVKGDVTIDVALSTDASPSSNDTVVDSLTVKEKIGDGKSAAKRLKISNVPAGLTPGNYYLVVQVTDPNGGIATTSSAGTIDVVAPQVDLSGAFKKAPVAAHAGKGLSASITVTNSGNVPAAGVLPIVVNASTVNTLDPAAVVLLPLNKKINIKPGKSITIPLSRLIAPAIANDYYLIVQLDPNKTLKNENTTSSPFATGSPIAVS